LFRNTPNLGVLVASVEDLIMEEAADVKNDQTVRQCCGVVLSKYINSCKFCVAKDSALLGYDTASVGNWPLTFQGKVVCSSPRVNRSYKYIISSDTSYRERMLHRFTDRLVKL
jgi:hypothetical protein